jgi:integrase
VGYRLLARERLVDAKRMISEGISPAHEKQREKRRLKEAKSFGEFGERWMQEAKMADSTRAMRRAIYERDILPIFRDRLLTEISPDDLRSICAKVKQRGAPATAVHVRDIVKLVYAFAILHGERVDNPADEVGPASIATFVPKDRSLSPSEIRIMLRQIEHIPTLPTIRLGMKIFLLTMVRKGELQDATWDEVDFENAVWSIPKEAVEVAQRLAGSTDDRHPDRAEDLCWKLKVRAALLAQRQEGPELIERMQRGALDVLGERVLLGNAAFADNAGHRSGLGKALLLHQQLQRPIAPAARRDLIHAGLDAVLVDDGADAEALQQAAAGDVVGQLLD